MQMYESRAKRNRFPISPNTCKVFLMRTAPKRGGSKFLACCVLFLFAKPKITSLLHAGGQNPYTPDLLGKQCNSFLSVSQSRCR